MRCCFIYIYDFINSIELLREPHIVDLNTNIQENRIYYGQSVRSELPLELQEAIKGEHFLLYSRIEEPFILEAINIDKILEFIALIDSEKIDLSEVQKDLLNASIYEAIWFFEEILCWDGNPFAKIKNSLNVLNALYNRNDIDDQPVLLFFETPISATLFQAEARYFIKKYLKARLELSNNGKGDDSLFDKVIRFGISNYFSKIPQGWKVGTMTDIDNQEFDEFIQQLRLKAEATTTDGK